jgi:hypothetical protein
MDRHLGRYQEDQVSSFRFRQLASVASAAMLSMLLLGAGVASAQTPAWSMAVKLIPGTVSPGAYAAYRVTITNGGTSNIAKLFLTDSITAHPYSVIGSAGCNATGPLFCSLGALNAGKSVTRTVVYQTPSTGTSFNVTFDANTSGSTFSDKGGTSHGDTLFSAVSTTLDGSANFAGGYVIDPNNPLSTGGGDNQQTTLDPPVGGIGVTISEGGTGNPCGFANTIGQFTAINVGDGATFTTPFETIFTIPTTSLNPELALSQVKLCHQYDNGTAIQLSICAADASPGVGGTPCFYPKWGGPQHQDAEEVVGSHDADDWTWLVLDAWDFQNGGYRGGLG